MIETWMAACCQGTALNPEALIRISRDLLANRQRLARHNNYFAIGSGTGNYRSYPTPAAGIQAGIEKILGNPEFVKMKIGTLKANPDVQYARLKKMLGIE